MRIDHFNIYEHQDSRVLLLSYLENRQENEESFSVRKWSKEMGLNSHSLLSLQLQGKRKVRLQHIERFATSMGLTEDEKRFFKGVTVLEKSSTKEERDYNLLNLIKSVPKEYVKTKKYNQFSILSDWIHMGIMALTEVTKDELTEDFINKHLGHKVSKFEIASAVRRLIDEGLLEKDGEVLKATYQSVCTTNDISDAGIKEYHRQASDLAKVAVDEVDLDHREFQSFTMAIDEDKLSLAKDMIRKFREELYQAVGGSGENIYKTNIQLFQLSRSTDVKSGAREFAQDNVQQQETLQ